MTTEVEDRRRRLGGVLVVLILAIIAAWLVYLWLDGIEGDGEVTADRPVATTATTAAPATTTTTVEATTTTVAPATTTTTTRPTALGVIESTIVDYEARLESIEKARLEG